MPKTTLSPPRGLRIRKVADKSTGVRVKRYDPETGEPRLVNPAAPGDDHEPWPLAGIVLEDAPERTRLATRLAVELAGLGVLTLEGQRAVVRPAGPTQDQLISTHTGQPHVFVHADALVFHTLDGDVRYRVTHQPDKYADGQAANDGPIDGDYDDDTPVTVDLYAAGATRVDHFYGLEKES